MKLKLLTLVVALLVAGALVLAGCGGLSSTAPTAPSGAPAPQPVTTSEPATPVQEGAENSTPSGAPAPQPVTTSEPATPVQEGAENSTPGTVSRSQAEQAALDAVGSGRVTWSGPEDDRGAAWEVEVTRPDGSEVDVLVAADGTIIKQVEKFGRGPARSGPGIPPASGVVSREQAAQAALDAVGEGQVTWISREDERGAAWEVEITRPDGSEIDVLVAPDGSIIE